MKISSLKKAKTVNTSPLFSPFSQLLIITAPSTYSREESAENAAHVGRDSLNRVLTEECKCTTLMGKLSVAAVN